MVVTAPAQQRPFKGLRPINLSRDASQVLKLLELCFGASLDADGQGLFHGSAITDQPPFLWRLNPLAHKLSMGYVWEENGRIVGNVTVLSAKLPGRYLVVNVAVHPNHRRQGIARQMMAAVADMVQTRQGQEIILQVVKENDAAVNLYKSLQYDVLGSNTSWSAPAAHLAQIPPAKDGAMAPYIREMRRHEWRDAYTLDVASLHPDLNWPEPIEPETYQTGFWRRLSDFFNGRQVETWVTTNAAGRLIGLGNIATEWGRSHYATIRVHPHWQGQLERPLLAKLIRRLHYLPRRKVRIDHPDNDVLMNELLREANFQPGRTLTHMRLEVK